MNLLRCANGHYFDGDKFNECPHCSEMHRDVTQTVPIEIEEVGPVVEPPITPIPEGPAVPQTPVTPEPPVGPVPGPWGGGDEVTVGYYSDLIGKEPVVGFLVCVRGKYYGESFELKTGRNFIGRAANMDVVLSMDPKVSRERHAIIVYEPRARVFVAQAGDSHGMLYVNDQVVLTNEPLKAYDKLSVGDTELMFVPFCGPQFSWEELQN